MLAALWLWLVMGSADFGGDQPPPGPPPRSAFGGDPSPPGPPPR